MTTRIRLLALISFATLSGAIAAPPLPSEAFKKATEADIIQLQKHLETCAADPKEAKRYAPTAKSLAMMIAMSAEVNGDITLRNRAVKVAGAVKEKDFAGAAATAKVMVVKGTGKSLVPLGLEAQASYNLEEVMSPFRGNKVGGLNIERDIRDMANGKAPVNVDTVRVLATRTAILGEYTSHFPNERAAGNPASQKEWAKRSKALVDVSQQLVEETEKKAPNNTEIIRLLKTLDAKCLDCHSAYRD